MLVSVRAASNDVAASVFSQLNVHHTHIRCRINEAIMTLKYVSTMLFVDYSIFRYIYIYVYIYIYIYTVPISEICICY